MLVALVGRLTFLIGVAISRSIDTEAGVQSSARIVSPSQYTSIRTGSDRCFDAYTCVSRRIGRPPVPDILVTDLRRLAFGICVTKNVFRFFFFVLPE